MSSPITNNPDDFQAAANVSASQELVVTPEMLRKHNLQALVELQYVRVGTEVMNSALTRLGDALTLTQKGLDQLASLQSLHNQIAVTADSSFPLNFTKTGSQTFALTSMNTLLSVTVPYTLTILANNQDNSFVKGYQILASAYYGKAIQPFFSISLPKYTAPIPPGPYDITPSHPAYENVTITDYFQPEYQTFLWMLRSSKAGLERLIAELEAANTNPNDPNTLLAKLRPVLDDFPDFNSFESVQKWAIDNYGGNTAQEITAQGKFQQNITNAITAAESTNTKQQEAVRRYMFVFEQYCQSAAAILNKLDQIFEKIARNIG
ncbi:MAG: hypothetical protein H0U49_01425 [Parachlamydiaceae bacterium]|nr:hypothetical protein [Parachlamydiaceae bacterium]